MDRIHYCRREGNQEPLTILGLMPSSCNELFLQMREMTVKRAGPTDEAVLQKIEEGNLARKSKQYKRSYEIRTELAAVGVALMDSPEGTTWRPGIPLDVPRENSFNIKLLLLFILSLIPIILDGSSSEIASVNRAK